MPQLGSSPRVWGQVFRAPCLSFPCRIIPTRVGTRNPLENLLNVMRDHPHACGDKFQKSLCFCRQGGSSPRVWGQDTPTRVFVCNRGIIPTRVGTRDKGQHGSTMSEDHPHACGDKMKGGNTMQEKRGSSPRVWGQAPRDQKAGFVLGIIPTRVGTRALSLRGNKGGEDHPHACGDKQYKNYR